jgi:hypothetical protein
MACKPGKNVEFDAIEQEFRKRETPFVLSQPPGSSRVRR